VEGVEMKGVGSGCSRQTCRLHNCHTELYFYRCQSYSKTVFAQSK